MDDEALTVLALLGLGYVVIKSSSGGGLFGGPDVPAGDVGPNGVVGPPRADSQGNSLASEIGAGVCIGGATIVGGIYGGPAGAAGGAKIGAAVSPLCAAAAPYVAKGAKYLGKEAAAGATFIAHYTAEGAKDVGKAGVAGANFAVKTISQSLTHPGSQFLDVNTKIATAATSGLALVDRGVNAGYAKLPTPLKIAVAPIKLTVDASTKIAQVATGVTNKVVSGVSSGVKSAENAVGSAANKVLGWL